MIRFAFHDELARIQEGIAGLSLRRAAEIDEADEYPVRELATLDDLGMCAHYVPAALGGSLVGLDQLAALARLVARRSPTVAVAHAKTYLGACPVWVGGSDAQKRTIAAQVLGRERLAIAFHERAWGGELLRLDTVATPGAEGYLLSGEKWLVNNATAGRTLVVIARTGRSPAPTLFIVDKHGLPAETFECTPRVRTVGLRGVDFSGIRFVAAPLSPDARLGREAGALDLAQRAFQLTRVTIPAISLGIADAALATVVRFATTRKRALGGTVAQLQPVRTLLAEVAGDLLGAEALAMSTCRAMSLVPAQGALHAALAKYYVTATVTRTLDALGQILGARSFLMDEHDHGAFQRLHRDQQAIPIFHMGPHLNVMTLAQSWHRAAPTSGGVHAVFDLAAALPAIDVDALQPNATNDEVWLGGLAALPELLGPGDAALRALIEALRDHAEHALARLRALPAVVGSDFSLNATAQTIAKELASYAAGAAVVQTWLANRSALDPWLADGDGVRVALARVLGMPMSELPASLITRVAAAVCELGQHERGALLP